MTGSRAQLIKMALWCLHSNALHSPLHSFFLEQAIGRAKENETGNRNEGPIQATTCPPDLTEAPHFYSGDWQKSA